MTLGKRGSHIKELARGKILSLQWKIFISSSKAEMLSRTCVAWRPTAASCQQGGAQHQQIQQLISG